MTDAILTAPVIADGWIYAVDGSGVAICADADSLKVLWQFAARGGPANCNDAPSSPAIVGRYLHFGTTAGLYYVLDRDTGEVVKELACDGPIFTTPVVSGDRAVISPRSEPTSTRCRPQDKSAGSGTSFARCWVSRETAGTAQIGGRASKGE